MTYKHILVAVDLSAESNLLVKKAVSIAELYHAKVSLIHADINYSSLYTGLIDANFCDTQQRISEETCNALTNLAKQAKYPITEILSSSGELSKMVVDAINTHKIDLLVCGHHQDFWSKLMSSARQLINHIEVDILIVPIRSNE